MSFRRGLAALTLAVLALSSMAVPAALAGGGTTIMVDNDGHAAVGNCGANATARKKIQQAIDVAPAGATILVCPGTYHETLVIATAGLILRSVGDWTAIIKTPAAPSTPVLVEIAADDVTLQGFKLLTRTDGECVSMEALVWVHDALHAVIRSNRLRALGPDTLGECRLFSAILVGEGVKAAGESTPATARVSYNLIQDFGFAGIVVLGDLSRAQIRRNAVHYFHLDVDTEEAECFLTAAAGIRGNALARMRRLLGPAIRPAGTEGLCFAFGIVQVNGATGHIRNNRVLSGPDSFPDLSETAGKVPSTPLLFTGILQLEPGTDLGETSIARNVVFRSLTGIGVLGGDGARIKENRVYDDLVAIYLHQTVNARVRDNDVSASFVGIGINDLFLVDSFGLDFGVTSHDNVLTGNDATSTEISCFDNTTGDGSQGTDNTWTDNDGAANSSDPVGICGPAGL